MFIVKRLLIPFTNLLIYFATSTAFISTTVIATAIISAQNSNTNKNQQIIDACKQSNSDKTYDNAKVGGAGGFLTGCAIGSFLSIFTGPAAPMVATLLCLTIGGGTAYAGLRINAELTTQVDCSKSINNKPQVKLLKSLSKIIESNLTSSTTSQYDLTNLSSSADLNYSNDIKKNDLNIGNILINIMPIILIATTMSCFTGYVIYHKHKLNASYHTLSSNNTTNSPSSDTKIKMLEMVNHRNIRILL